MENTQTQPISQQQSQKPILIPRAVSTIDMLNLINDKLDYLIAKAEEKK